MPTPAVPEISISYTGEARSEFAIMDALEVIRHRWLLFATGMIACLALAAAYYVISRPKYESTAQILVMRKNPNLAPQSNDSNTEESRVSEDLLATHMQLVQSHRIVHTALAKYEYDKLPSIVDYLKRDQTPTEFVIDRLRILRGGSGQARTAHVLTVSFRHTSETEAQNIVKAIIESYQAFLSEKFMDVNKEAAELISQAQDKLKSDIDVNEEAYQTFRENSEALLWKQGEDNTMNVHRLRYEEIQREIAGLHVETASARARLEVVEENLKAMESEDATDLERLSLIDDKSVTRLGVLVTVNSADGHSARSLAEQPQRLEQARVEFESLLKLLAEEQTLKRDYGPQHPHVLSVHKQIEVVQEYLGRNTNLPLPAKSTMDLMNPQNVVTAYLRLLRHDLQALRRRDAELAKMSSVEEVEVKKLITQELQEEALRKRIKRSQDLYDAIVDRLREINLTREDGGFINEIIMEPEQGRKVEPKLSLVLAFGLLLGILVGGGGVALAEVKDRRFRDSNELRKALDMQLLAHVPDLTVSDEIMATSAAAGEKLSRILHTFFAPKSIEAETFRSMRTMLLVGARANNWRVVECTSAVQGDGKSTIVANLAVSVAQIGRRVLVIDCDMRRPNLGKLFGMKGERTGLSNVISGQTDLQSAVVASDIPNLWVLPCGERPKNPAELLASAAFEQLIKDVREQYDFIFLDCPPVLPVADPCIVAPHADGVMLVVRVGTDSRPITIRARETLAEVGAKMIGVIVNTVDVSSSFLSAGYSGYGYGGYGYAYKRSYYQQYEYRPDREYYYGADMDASAQLAKGQMADAPSTNGSEPHPAANGRAPRLD